MLSKKTQYALKALTYMAEQQNAGPFLIAEIAKQKKIPKIGRASCRERVLRRV